MADEPRRSGRPTKGVHTKMDTLEQTPEPKKKSTKKSKKAAAKEEEGDEDEDPIRCVCGATSSPPDDPDPWVGCDKCRAWQHNVCVGISTFEEDVPEVYLCEQCGPEFHKPLLEAMKKGLKLWEVRRKEYNAHRPKSSKTEQREAAEELKKNAGKKKGKRASEATLEAGFGANGKSASPATPADGKKEKKEPTSKAGSVKRKIRDESQDKELSKEPKPKVRKVSAVQRQESPPSNLPTKVSELQNDPIRQGAANLLLKSLLVAVRVSMDKGVYMLNKGDSQEAKAERLALQIENAIYVTHPDQTAYGSQARTVASNLKRNQDLCNSLLNRKLSPAALSVMTSDDMASKELKRQTAEMQARADKQSIMVSEDGPRVRRTHKGEELVGGDDFAIGADETANPSRIRRMADPNDSLGARSRENSVGEQVELPEDIDSYRSHDDIRGNAGPKLAINTQPKRAPVRKESTQGDFDINKVFSSVQAQSPTIAQHSRRASSNNVPPADGPGVDPEIDKMLQDDEGDSDAYSPAEYTSDPEVVWRGGVTMDSVAKFSAAAKHVAGMDIGRVGPWTDFLLKDLRVAGKIDPEKASEYLCSLRYSPPTDVSVVDLIPSGEASKEAFMELYNYFHSRKRYGVLTNKGAGNVRDTYLVPVPPSPASLPDFITNLESHRLPETRSDAILLVVLVVRNEWQPDAQRSFESNPETQSPSVNAHAHRQMSISGTGPAMSPIPPQGSGSFSTPPMPQQQFPPPGTQYRQQQDMEQRTKDQREGEAVAVRILGASVDAPTVAFLMPQAFQMRPVEWEIIRGILEEDEKARVDLQHLSQVLEIRMGQLGPQGTR